MVGTVRKEGAGGVATHTHELSQRLIEKGIDVERFNIHPKKNYWQPIDLSYKLLSRTIILMIYLFLHHDQYDIIHIQTSGPIGGFLPALTASMFKKIKNINLIVTFHYRPNREFLIDNYSFFQFSFKKIDHLFVISEKNKILILDLFEIKNEKISQIPNGFNTSLFYEDDKSKCRKELDLLEQKSILVSVGSIKKEKGYTYLIKAIKKIVGERKNVELFIIGGGNQREIKKEIEKLNLSKYITLVGSRPHKEIPKWINAADVLIFPSLIESFGIVQIEALACATPVVATKNPGSNQIIKSEEIGLLAEKKDPEDLAEKINQALDKKWDNEKLKNYVEVNYKWERVADQTVDVYYEMI